MNPFRIALLLALTFWAPTLLSAGETPAPRAKDEWALRKEREDWTLRKEREDWTLRKEREKWEIDARQKQLAQLLAKAPAPPPTPATRLDKISAGMSSDDVVKHMGRPPSKDAEYWIYPEGYIEFSATGRVTRIRHREIPPSTNRVVISVTGLSPSDPGQYGYAVRRNDILVNGYTRANGTYVDSYHRTLPNDTRNDNYSTRGNVNPYTGQAGTKPRDEDVRGYEYRQAARDYAAGKTASELISTYQQCQQLIQSYTDQHTSSSYSGDRVTADDVKQLMVLRDHTRVLLESMGYTFQP